MKTRKILSVLLAAAMLIGLMPAFTVSFAVSVDDLSLELDYKGESYSITDCDMSVSGELIIPDTYNGKPITKISYGAFYNCSNITGVTIPAGVTIIGEGSFAYCTSLTTVNYNAVDCNYWYLDDGGSVHAFENCPSLTNINIGEGVKAIPSYIFSNSTAVTTVSFPNSLEEIGNRAFYGCTDLTNLTIPDSVMIIGGSAFDNTDWYNDQPDGLIYIGKVAYAYKGTMPGNTSIALSDGTKSIAGSAFEECTGLTSITIPDSVTSIGDWAFWSCTGLTSITIPNSVTSIGEWAFWGCTGLTSITIPNSVIFIDDSVFSGCTGLTSITIPDSVTSIGDYAFYDCDNLTIHCNSGSTAEEYAIENGINYAAIGGTQAEEILSDTLTVSEGIISGLRCGDSVESTLEELNTSENVKIFGLDGNEITDTAAKLGTGMVIKLFDEDGEVLDEVTVSVLGDLDGNGEVTTDDARNVLRATVGLETPNNAQRIAADVTETAGDDPVTTDDARFILRVTVGLEIL